MPYLGIFELEGENYIPIFKISTLQFVNNGSLTHTVNFGIGISAFCKVLGSTFSESPGPDLGLLYKICHLEI